MRWVSEKKKFDARNLFDDYARQSFTLLSAGATLSVENRTFKLAFYEFAHYECSKFTNESEKNGDNLFVVPESELYIRRTIVNIVSHG